VPVASQPLALPCPPLLDPPILGLLELLPHLSQALLLVGAVLCVEGQLVHLSLELGDLTTTSFEALLTRVLVELANAPVVERDLRFLFREQEAGKEIARARLQLVKTRFAVLFDLRGDVGPAIFEPAAPMGERVIFERERIGFDRSRGRDLGIADAERKL